MADGPQWDKTDSRRRERAQEVTGPTRTLHDSQIETQAGRVDAGSAEAVEVGPGQAIGRYVVLQEVGRGAMGVVYAAYDPELDRRVAIKVLARDDSESGETHRRHVREAKALARLSHPHVITIHDVGVWRERLFLAMEFVDGSTLRAWSGEPDRSAADVLEALVKAGRGLAAAHDAGLVHRDFKPDNVLVSRQGEVYVTDFGTARGFGDEPEPASPSSASSASSASSGGVDSAFVSATLTKTGALVGTPLFMAPEQLLGRRATHASDQYAFCVTVFRCLSGRMPFYGVTVSELFAKVRAGLDPQALAELPVSSRVRRALARGLHREPGERWPSLARLLEELEVEQSRRRSRSWLVALAAAGVTAAVASTLGSPAGDQAAECSGAQRELEGIWDADQRQSLGEALLATELPYAQASADFAHKTFDDYAEMWAREHRDACEATLVRKEQSQDAMDLRMACLWRAKVELQARVELLREADRDVAERVLEVASSLPALEQCSDIESLRMEVLPPSDPAVLRSVEDGRAQLARLSAELEAGRYQVAWEGLEGVTQSGAVGQYPPFLVEVLLVRGRVSTLLGKYEDAERELREALEVSLRHSANRLASRCASRLSYVVGNHLRRHDEGRSLAEVALGLAQSGRWRAEEIRAHHALALVHLGRGDITLAEQEARVALRLSDSLQGPDVGERANLQMVLADVLQRKGEYDEAIEVAEAVLDLQKRTQGIGHPLYAQARFNLGALIGHQGDYARLESEFRGALALQEEVLGPGNPDAIATRHGLAAALLVQGKPVEAEALFRQTIELMLIHAPQKRLEIAQAHHNLGKAIAKLGREDEARAMLEQSVHEHEEALGPQHPETALVLQSLGALEARAGRLEAARRHLDRGWALRKDAEVAPGVKGQTALLLSQVRWAQGERESARELAQTARTLFTTGGNNREKIDAVDRWLDSHPMPEPNGGRGP